MVSIMEKNAQMVFIPGNLPTPEKIIIRKSSLDTSIY